MDKHIWMATEDNTGQDISQRALAVVQGQEGAGQCYHPKKVKAPAPRHAVDTVEVTLKVTSSRWNGYWTDYLEEEITP
jgi:hypothetical protein